MEIKFIPPFSQEDNLEGISNLQEIRKEVYEKVQTERLAFHGMGSLPREKVELIRILMRLNILNDFENKTKQFKFANVSDKSLITGYITEQDHFNIVITYDTNSYIRNWVQDINRRNEVKPLPGLEEVLSQENNSIITAYVRNKSMHIISDKTFTVKQLLMILRLQYTILKEEYTTPNENYPALIDALLNEDTVKASEYLNEMMQDTKLKEYNAEHIGKIFEYNKMYLINETTQRINDLRAQLEDLENSYMSKQQTLKDKLDYLAYITTKEDDVNTKQIGNYLLEHPYITKVVNENNNSLLVTYCAPLINLNIQAAEDAKTYRNDFANKIINTMLYHEDKYTLYTSCVIKVWSDLSTEAIIGANRYEQFIGQPHLDNHNCYGNHIDNIRNFAEHRNVIGLFDQLTEMVMNMNFKDGIVTDDLIRELANHRDIKTWLHNESGEYVTTNEVLEDLYGEA